MSIEYLIETYKNKKDDFLRDKKSIECLKQLSCSSLKEEFINEDALDNYFNLLFDSMLTLSRNLKSNYDLNLFKTNNPRKENILMLTRLVGLILNYSNNSISFSRILNERLAEINDFFQIVYRIIINLDETNDKYAQLICFSLTSLDLIFFYYETNKNARFDSDFQSKISHLSQLSSLDKFYLNKIKYCLIRFDSQSDLDNEENKQILLEKYNTLIDYFKQNSININLNNQFNFNSLRFLRKYSRINPIKYDINLIKTIINTIDNELVKTKINKSNLCLLFEILLNYSISNVEFTKEFQQIDNSVKFLFNCLETFIKLGQQTNHNYLCLIETLIDLMYFIAKQSHLFQDKWTDLKIYLFKIIESNDTFNDKILSRCNQIIKTTYDYTNFEVIFLNDQTIFDYLNNLKIEHNVFKQMSFRDALILLSNLTFQNKLKYDNLNEVNRKILNKFLDNFIEYSIDYILNKNEENLANTVKIFSYLYDILKICFKLASISIEFCHQLQLNTIPLLIKFMLDESLLIDKTNKINYYLIQTLVSELICLVNKVFSTSTNISTIIDWNDIKMIESLINSSLKFNDKIINQMIDLITYQYGYTQNAELIDYASFQKLDEQHKIELLTQSLKVIFNFNQLDSLLENRNCLNPLIYLATNYTIVEKLDLSLQNDFVKFSIDFFEFSLNELTKLEHKRDFNDLFLKLIKAISYFNRLMSLNCNIGNISIKYCSLFHKNIKNGILIMIKILNSDIIYNEIINQNSNLISILLKKAYDVTLLTLHNISRVSYKYRAIWEDRIEPLKVIFNLANKYTQISESFQLTLYLIIANLATDDDIQVLVSSIKQVLKSIVDKIDIIANILETESSDEITRIQISLNENDDKQVNVVQYNSWHLIELITPLFSVSKCDAIKWVIYNDYNMREILNRIIFNGNDVEQGYALKLLYQLCFDNNIAREIMANKRLYDLIEKKSSKLKNCKGIIWVLKNKFNKSTNEVVTQNQSIPEKKQQHIMISYNRESREFCLRIKEELEKIGKNCWIDVENIHGSSLESMANAIEQSTCVLLCMTEKYKESPNCRLEAEYVIQIKKPFVPLIMQKGYKPNGWLGLILGSKIFIDITKYEFEECIKRLVKEIDNLTRMNSNEPKEISLLLNDKNIKSNAIKWTQSQVMKWLNEKKINKFIIRVLGTECNGELLNQIFNMYLKAPQFVLKKLVNESNCELKLVDLAHFTMELERLYRE